MTKQVIFLLYLISDFVGVKYFFIQTKLVIMSYITTNILLISRKTMS